MDILCSFAPSYFLKVLIVKGTDVMIKVSKPAIFFHYNSRMRTTCHVYHLLDNIKYKHFSLNYQL